MTVIVKIFGANLPSHAVKYEVHFFDANQGARHQNNERTVNV